MARPRKDQTTGDTAARIRAEALAQFGLSGFQATSLAEIAEAVGVTRTTLLYYFESKEKLYADVVQDAFTQLASVLVASMLQGGPFRLRVRAMIKDFLAYVDERPHLAKLLVRDVVDERGPGVAIVRDQGMPVLQLVESFFEREVRLRPKQKGLLREILLQLTTSVMLRSASGVLRETFWGDDARAGELTTMLLDALIEGARVTQDQPRAESTP